MAGSILSVDNVGNAHPETPGYNLNLYMRDHRHGGLSPAVVESVAGLSAGVISTLVVHPLDIVKTRMQSWSNLAALIPLPFYFPAKPCRL